MITTECNQRCSKCSHWKNTDSAPRLEAFKMIDCVKALTSAKEVCIVGGEPLLFKNEIIDIIEGISGDSLRVVVITNGVLLSKDFVKEVSGYNIHFVVSIDTIDREFWKYVRGTDSYDIVFDNLENAFYLLEKRQISIQSVLAKQTMNHIMGVREYADKNKVFHSIQHYLQEGFNGSWNTIKDECGNEIGNMDNCCAVNRNLSILQNGNVYTCFQQNLIENCNEPLGNLNKNSINEIIASPYLSKVIDKMTKCNLRCKILKCNNEKIS